MHTHCQITDTPTDRPPSYEDLCNADADLAHSVGLLTASSFPLIGAG